MADDKILLPRLHSHANRVRGTLWIIFVVPYLADTFPYFADDNPYLTDDKPYIADDNPYISDIRSLQALERAGEFGLFPSENLLKLR